MRLMVLVMIAALMLLLRFETDFQWTSQCSDVVDHLLASVLFNISYT